MPNLAELVKIYALLHFDEPRAGKGSGAHKRTFSASSSNNYADVHP
jgi:hypothetical protein